MQLDPLWHAGPLIASHALLALAAFGLGLAQLALPKGTGRHRVMGWLWVALMLGVAFSSFFIWDIRSFGPFSYIHILSVVTLWGLYDGVTAARSGRVRSHRATMISLFAGALLIAGAFTFMPYRVMNDVVTGRMQADRPE